MKKLWVALFTLVVVSFPIIEEIDAYQDSSDEILVLQCNTVDSLDFLDSTESFKRDDSLRHLC